MLVHLSIIEMTCHVIFLWVIVYYSWLWVIVLGCFSDLVVELVCSDAKGGDGGGDLGFYVGVFTLGPIILITNICPADSIIKSVAFVGLALLLGLDFRIISLFLNLFLDFLLSFWLLFLLLVEFFSAVEVGTIGLETVDVQGLTRDV